MCVREQKAAMLFFLQNFKEIEFENFETFNCDF